jgi:hypothetical protein
MKCKREHIERVTVTGRFEEKEAAMKAFASNEWECRYVAPRIVKSTLKVSQTHFQAVFERLAEVPIVFTP